MTARTKHKAPPVVELDDEIDDGAVNGAPLSEPPPAVDVESPLGVVDAALAQLGPGESVVNVMRRASATGTLKYLRRIAVTPDFSLDLVRETWGGGKYVLSFFSPDERGRQQHVRSVTVDIEGEPHAPPVERAAPGIADVEALARATAGPGSSALELEVARLRGLVEGLTQGRAATADPLEMLERLTTIMRNTQPPAAAAGNPSEILAFAREAVGFAKEMAPGSGDTSAWEKMIDKVGAPALELIRQGMAQRAGGAAPPAALPAATDGAGPVNATEWLQLAPHVRQLVIRAQQGRDPELAAEGFLEEMEHSHPALFEEIASLALQPGFVAAAVERLALLDLRVSEPPIRAWVEKFAAAVVTSFADAQATNEPRPDDEPAT